MIGHVAKMKAVMRPVSEICKRITKTAIIVVWLP